jgi:hypothetical protein
MPNPSRGYGQSSPWVGVLLPKLAEVGRSSRPWRDGPWEGADGTVNSPPLGAHPLPFGPDSPRTSGGLWDPLRVLAFLRPSAYYHAIRQ